MFTNCKWGGTQGRAHISGQPGRGRENPGAWWAGGGGQGMAEASGELSPRPPLPPSPALLVSIETLIPVGLCHLTCTASECVPSQCRAMLWAPLLGLPAPPKTLRALWILGGKERHSRTSETPFNSQRCVFIPPGSQSVVPRPAASVSKCMFLGFEK